MNRQTPIQSPNMTTPSENSSVTVVVRRRTKPGCEADFEAAMREFVDFILAFPGNRGIHILRSEHANPREYTMIDRFKDTESRKEFTHSPAYRDWMIRLRALTTEDPHIIETGGLSGWFTVPDQPTAHPPPKLKMALVTFLGVYPLTSTLPKATGNLLTGWHPLLVNVVATGLIVILLSWVVMPTLVKCFRAWLFPQLKRS